MKNEVLIKKNKFIPMNNIYNIYKSTVQIEYQNKDDIRNSSD